jgi:hypothetical protein
MGWYGWRPYVRVAVRQARALNKMEKLVKHDKFKMSRAAANDCFGGNL